MLCLKKKSKSFHKSSKLYNVVNNFEETNVNECTQMDKLNEKIYNNLLEKANKAQNNVKNSSIYMNIEVPPPPRPSNRDKYILWNKRNVNKSVIEQSESVIFLQSKGFKYDVDYEAYQAIDLAIEYKKKHGIHKNDVDKSKNFDNIFTKSDKNIMRRKSIQRVNHLYSKKNRQEEQEYFPETHDNDFNNIDLNNTDFMEKDIDHISNIKKITNITNITSVEPTAPPLTNDINLYPNLEI